MRPEGPTSWLLDGRAGWRTAYEDGIVAAGLAGIRLAPASGGPLSPASAHGTLGGLRPPTVLAVACGDVYLLVRDRRQVLRFDPATDAFAALPALGADGDGARTLDDPVTVAAAGDALYVADRGSRRVLVLSRTTLTLRAVWERAWDPIALAAAGGRAYVLDHAGGRVWRHHPAADRPELVVDGADDRWSDLAVDRDGRIYLYDGEGLDVYRADGTPDGRVSDAGGVRERFESSCIRVEDDRFSLRGRAFDFEGHPAQADPADRGPRPWVTQGTWISSALDSEIPGCQWHRIELELLRLPAGSSIELRTYADDRRRGIDDLRALPPDLWETRHELIGAMQPGGVESPSSDLLVQSRPGRYLWLRVTLRSDGYATPAITSMRVHYPRASYLEYLPEAYSAQDETRWFLERLLSIAQTEWDAVEQRSDDMPVLFDPAGVPAGAPLAYLASWLALPLEGAWPEEAKRHLLAGVPKISAGRGTLAEVRAFLRLYLESIRGTKLGGEHYPALVEGFRERAHLMLSAGDAAAVDPGAPLWSRRVVGRLQLGVYSRAGEARLVSTGDPQRDLFHEYAHRFRVFVPAAWVRTTEEERMIRRALDAEKPAHTTYELCLVEPRLRVGVQCTVGVDTIVAGHPELRLPCEPPEDQPESRGPRGRLGYDTVLAAGGGADDQRIGTTPPLI